MCPKKLDWRQKISPLFVICLSTVTDRGEGPMSSWPNWWRHIEHRIQWLRLGIDEPEVVDPQWLKFFPDHIPSGSALRVPHVFRWYKPLCWLWFPTCPKLHLPRTCPIQWHQWNSESAERKQASYKNKMHHIWKVIWQFFPLCFSQTRVAKKGQLKCPKCAYFPHHPCPSFSFSLVLRSAFRLRFDSSLMIFFTLFATSMGGHKYCLKCPKSVFTTMPHHQARMFLCFVKDHSFMLKKHQTNYCIQIRASSVIVTGNSDRK